MSSISQKTRHYVILLIALAVEQLLCSSLSNVSHHAYGSSSLSILQSSTPQLDRGRYAQLNWTPLLSYKYTKCPIESIIIHMPSVWTSSCDANFWTTSVRQTKDPRSAWSWSWRIPHTMCPLAVSEANCESRHRGIMWARTSSVSDTLIVSPQS